MARPELPEAEKRCFQTSPIRLTAEENELLLELVMQSGMSKSQFIRHAILNKKITVIHKKGFDFKQRRDFLAVANNINQMTKRFNATGKQPPPILEDMVSYIYKMTIEANEE